ncbi:ABC transporter permease [Marinisporobacter balticus]|uniref:ABC-2 type transport system permease protein n=1 Tax=Marinisporobacter balticus TaxID=2018667 RepID=A0A4V2SBU7_9FIRM|nr:ABC transporter permease [Marinisporobacter balticus]TCO76880.1 hypothetical protein EV214_10737 [Marinisporobacter balticus]
MLNVLYTEILKLKRAKILWLLPIGGILPSVLILLIIMGNSKTSGVHWNWELAFENNILFMSLIMAVALFSLISGYVFSREYTENMVNTLYTYPVDKSKFVFAKLMVILIIIFATLAINFGFMLAGGMFVIQESLNFHLLMEEIKKQLWIGSMFFVLSPVSAVLGVIGKNVIPPIVLGISAVITNVIVCNSKYIDVFPWCIPTDYVFRANAHDPKMITVKAWIILGATFMISLVALIGYLKKSDVHA